MRSPVALIVSLASFSVFGNDLLSMFGGLANSVSGGANGGPGRGGEDRREWAGRREGRERERERERRERESEERRERESEERRERARREHESEERMRARREQEREKRKKEIRERGVEMRSHHLPSVLYHCCYTSPSS
eukprot:1363552-Amorphochlora_amoeboformis.AAC.2